MQVWFGPQPHYLGVLAQFGNLYFFSQTNMFICTSKVRFWSCLLSHSLAVFDASSCHADWFHCLRFVLLLDSEPLCEMLWLVDFQTYFSTVFSLAAQLQHTEQALASPAKFHVYSLLTGAGANKHPQLLQHHSCNWTLTFSFPLMSTPDVSGALVQCERGWWILIVAFVDWFISFLVTLSASCVFSL